VYDDPHPAGWPDAAPVEPLLSLLATHQALIRLGHDGKDDVSADPELGMTLDDVTPAQLRECDATTIRVGCLPHLTIVPAASVLRNPLLETCL
jgi:hypothetical protein